MFKIVEFETRTLAEIAYKFSWSTPDTAKIVKLDNGKWAIWFKDKEDYLRKWSNS